MQAFQDAFISYGRADSRAFAARLNRRLVDQGFTIWFDFDDIPLGVDYQKQIDDGIDKADNFLFIISPHSVNSPYCHLEIELALKRNKRIIPLLHVEQISRETWQQRHHTGSDADWEIYQMEGQHSCFPNMHPAISKINWVYCRETIDDFEVSLTNLIAIFDRHRDYVHQHTVLLAKALEWESHQKRLSYLLIGEEQLQAEKWLRTQFDSQAPCIPTALHCEFITESRKNSDNLMTEVFFTYAEENQTILEKICNSLRREGFTIWTNTIDIQIGEEFQEAIDRGIEEADNVVYLLSSFAVRSPWCQHELEYALLLHKRIIPVMIETIPVEQIPLSLRNLQYIDLTDNGQETDYHQDERQLVRILHQEAIYHKNHKLLLTKALKWERQHHNPAMLLRGYDLRHAEAWLKVAQLNPSYPPLSLQATFITESLRQPPGVSLDVFISYSRIDSGFARKLNEALQIHGKRTWFDQESIAVGTADFQKEIHQGIASADIFLFILSPRSVTSSYCADEVKYASSLNKRFVTLLHQPIDPSTLPPELVNVQWLDFSQHESSFSAKLTELLQILNTDMEHLQVHTRLLLRAIEWDSKGRSESLLLRGEDLKQAEQWLGESQGKEPSSTKLQQTYLTTSRSVEDAHQQATRILQEAATKGKRLVQVGVLAGSVGLLVAGGSGFIAHVAWSKLREANLTLATVNIKLTTVLSRELVLNQPFEALLTALTAGQQLKQLDPIAWSINNTELEVVSSLQQTVYSVGEYNHLDGHQSAIYSVSFSPDTQMIASSSVDNTIKLWNAKTGQEIRTLSGHNSWVYSIQFSPDGKTIASSSSDSTIKLWNVDTGQEIRTLSNQQDLNQEALILSIDFSPDGETIVSGNNEGVIKLWNVETGQEIRTFPGHQADIVSVAFSPDGQMFASSSLDGSVKLWRVQTGTEIRTLSGHKDLVYGISFSPDGKVIASGSNDRTIKLWDVATGQELRTISGHQDAVHSVSFSPDGQTIISGSYDSTIKLWRVNTGKEIRTFSGHHASVLSVSFSPDGQTIISGAADKTIKLWRLNAGKEIYTFDEHQEPIRDINFSPDGQTIASGSADTTIKLWNVKTGQVIRTLSGHKGWVNSLKISPDSQTLVSGSADGTVKVWKLATGQLLRTFSSNQDWVWSVDFSPDGQTIAANGTNGTVSLWNVETGQLLHILSGHIGPVRGIRFSPDGQILASGSDDTTIKLWNIKTGRLLHTLSGHQNWVWSVDFSPDGRIIASSSADGTIKLWSVETGQLLRTLAGHQSWVLSVSFSPDGKTLVSGSDDTTVKLWSVDTGQLLSTLTGHERAVLSTKFSPDGQTIASASFDATVRLWSWNIKTSSDIDSLMTMGCDWIRQYLITHPSDRPLCDGYLPQN